MKPTVLSLIMLVLAGCASSGITYLGVRENACRTIEQENPEIDSRLHGLTTVSKVETVNYDHYLELKRSNRISSLERHGRFLYFAVHSEQHVPFGEGPSVGAYVDVVERYRTLVPGENQTVEQEDREATSE